MAQNKTVEKAVELAQLAAHAGEHVMSDFSKCGFCRISIVNEDGSIKIDAIWMTIFGCWLCHYCHVGYLLNKEGR